MKDLKKGEASVTPEIMTLTEVAERLRIHRTTVISYVKSGGLRSYTIGKRRLFRASDVEKFFENQVALESVFAKEV